MLPSRFGKLREAKGLTQAQLAEELSMSVRAITAWEAGDRKPPIDKLEWLADFYGVSTDYLLGRTDFPGSYVVPPGNPPEMENRPQIQESADFEIGYPRSCEELKLFILDVVYGDQINQKRLLTQEEENALYERLASQIPEDAK